MADRNGAAASVEDGHFSPYTETEVEVLGEKLKQQLGPEWISSRPGPGKKMLWYISGEKSFELANEVFGFNGWYSVVKSVVLDFVSCRERFGVLTRF
jgi:DNA repair and recombination protein RAD52